MITFRTFGDWKRMNQGMDDLPAKMHAALHGALIDEADSFERALVAGVESGAPGGMPFAPHAPLTDLLSGGGGNVMVRSRAMLGSIGVYAHGDSVFVGVRGERAKVASRLEAGATYQRRWTPASRGWFFGALRRAGVTPSTEAGTGGVVNLQPRPFVAPVAEKELGDAALHRIAASFGRRMGGFLGSP